MRGLKDESFDLIYLDPPFNSNHNYAAPIGSEAAGAEFKDTWALNGINDSWWGGGLRTATNTCTRFLMQLVRLGGVEPA